MALLAYTLCFGSIMLLSLASFPSVMRRGKQYLAMRAHESAQQLGQIYLDMSHQRLRLLHALAPPAMAVVFWAIGGVAAAAAGLVIGLLVPKLVVKQLRKRRVKKFHAQLVDGLLLLSSCLRAGLSMVQAFSVLVEEMPPPISEEFGLLLKETRMGVGLDEALGHLRDRMPSDDFILFVTAVLVARETGGDITAVFGQLVETLRERKKIRERVKTLSFMARMQGMVMAILPVAFAYAAYSANPEHFTYFLSDDTGRVLLALVVIFQVMAVVLFARFSRAPM